MVGEETSNKTTLRGINKIMRKHKHVSAFGDENCRKWWG